MLDDLNPPHVYDETPLDTPPHEKAGIFARRFRNAAMQFRNPSGTLDRLHLGNERYAEYPTGLKEKCGKWIIQADKAGLIPDGQKQLRDLVVWHVAENPKELPPNRMSMYVRCPSNLFSDVCGGGVLVGVLRGMDERGRVILEDSRETGGLMPRLADGHLELSHNERYAATCEWLADVIERAAAAAPVATTPTEGGPPTSNRFAAVREFARQELTKQQKKVLEALCDANGELSLADIKTLCEWVEPIDDQWNALRRRINAKISHFSLTIVTHDRHARLTESEATSN